MRHSGMNRKTPIRTAANAQRNMANASGFSSIATAKDSVSMTNILAGE